MTARRLGVEFNPHLVGGTEHFLRRLFVHLDRARFVPVAIASAPGRWQTFLDGVAETHVVPYLDGVGAPADVTAALRLLHLDLVQSSYFAPVIALAAAQLGLPHIWRLGGHVRLIDRSERERRQFLAIVQLTSQRMICASGYLASQFDGTGAPPIDVIRNGIDLDELSALEPSESSPGAARVAMLAHLVPSKRHDIFLRAAAVVAAQRPTTRFFVFGGEFPTPDMRAYAQRVQDLAHELGLDGVCSLRELRDDRLAVLRTMDLVAMPVEHEGSSNAILEAMALGKPVIAARSGSNAELVCDGASGLIVPPADAEALAAAMFELIDNPSRRAALGAAARRRTEREFDIRVCARRYADLYAQVVGPTLPTRR